MAKKTKEAQNPLILRSHRLMDAFAKSDDERDFYLDRVEGFIIFVDLDKSEEELKVCQQELAQDPQRYCPIPKLSFYETKKIMEGFVHEKVYDIDTKEKLLDIIQSKEARENFIEFIYDQHAELEKWQQFYQERSRIRIIEWLRNHHFHFVFEEDLDLNKSLIEKLKENLFESKVSKDVEAGRKALVSKAKTYYSNEALNPRPKRGRPPKQSTKLEIEPQVTADIYTTVPKSLRPFLFTPDISSACDITFSAKFESREELLASKKMQQNSFDTEISLESLNQKLESLRSLSSQVKKALNEEPVRIREDLSPPAAAIGERDASKTKKVKQPTPKPSAKKQKAVKKPTTKAKSSTAASAKAKPKKAAPAKKKEVKPSTTKKRRLTKLTPAKEEKAKEKKKVATKKKAATLKAKPTSKKKIHLRRTKKKNS